MNPALVTSELVFAPASVSSSRDSGVQTQHTILSFLQAALLRARVKSEMHNVMAYQKSRKIYADGLKSSKKCPL